VLCHLLRRIDRRALSGFYLSALDALSASTSPEAVVVLDTALTQRDWRTPLRNRRFRSTAAQALRMIGTPGAIDALKSASKSGPLGARLAARAELARVG
jgi:HEAT repeat protein